MAGLTEGREGLWAFAQRILAKTRGRLSRLEWIVHQGGEVCSHVPPAWPMGVGCTAIQVGRGRTRQDEARRAQGVRGAWPIS